ncbi:MAG: hypothetical protein ACLP2P_08905 [Desulfobaccales bacterium]
MRTDERFQKWSRWIETIMQDIQMVYFHRSMYDGLSELVEKYDQQDKETLFFAFLQNIFVDSLVMGIRRQIKAKDKNSISLAGLLGDIIKSPQLVTRKDYYDLWERHDPISHVFMVQSFSQFVAQDASHIDASLVQNDLDALKNACKSAESIADRRVAHRDKRGLSTDITLQEMVKALDRVGEIARKYYLLFTAADIELYPRVNDLPWPRPWIDLFYEKGT